MGAERQVMHGIKLAGVALFAPEKGGKLEVWRMRPLPEVLVKYCAQDVVHLFAMLDTWSPQLLRSILRAMSEERMRRRIENPTLEAGPQLARKDFRFPWELTADYG